MNHEIKRCTECGSGNMLVVDGELLTAETGQYVCSYECKRKLDGSCTIVFQGSGTVPFAKRNFEIPYETAEPVRTVTGRLQGGNNIQTLPKEAVEPKVSDISDTLKERGCRYGKFTEQARITQNLKAAMKDSPNWKNLAADQKEALEMVQHKIARILNGDPDFVDSWFDQEGYIKLVRVRLETGEKI